ncbi:MAG: family 16 glycoside hydrolase [Phycisphaerales bacterium]
MSPERLLALAAGALLIAAGSPALSQPGDPARGPAAREEARIPGVTVWVYDLGEELRRRPTIAPGQTPNVYSLAPQIRFEGAWPLPEGQGEPLKEFFAGEVRGWLNIDEATRGVHQFRLECDDGAALIIDGTHVADTAHTGSFVAEGSADLAPGLRSLSLPFYNSRGKFHLRLSWRRGGDQPWTLVPPELFRTEAGQTFATSPGPKRWYYGNDPRRPGDGRPLESVHPSMTLENFRGPDFQPPVGGMAFLPDGRLAVSTWDPTGSVYILSNLDGREPGRDGHVRVERFASGLGEPLGIAFVNGALLVTQKQEVTRLVDTDADGVADVYETLSGGWPASHNYHEFSFNLVPLNGSLYVTTSVPLRSGSTNYVPGSTPAYSVAPGPGSLLRIDARTGHRDVIATGLRAPNGLCVGVDGELFGCDNQGCWLPSSRLNHLRPGGFYGHQTEPNGTTPADPPVAWFPQGEIGNSPTDPILIHDGPYRGQLLVGDVTYGGLQRVALERVEYESPAGRTQHYQGAVFRFSQGIEAGVNRLAWGPDGCLYVGGIGANGNWNHNNTRFGLQRLRPNGQLPFEMFRIDSRRDGLVITLTRPAPRDALANPASWRVASWRYEPTIAYGGPKINERTHAPASIDVSDDRTRVFLRLSDLAPGPTGRVAYVRMRGLRDDSGEEAFSTEAWMTLNTMRPLPGPGFDAPDPRPAAAQPPAPPDGAVILFDGSGTAALRHPDGSPATWKTDRGDLLADPSGAPGLDLLSRESFGDCRLHVEWLSPPGGDPARQLNGNSGVKLQERYEIQILNTAGPPRKPLFNEAGAIYRQKPADVNASLGAGVWQTYDIDFRAPRWQDGRKVSNARISLRWNGILVHDDVEVTAKTGASKDEAPGDHPVLLQSHRSEAAGPVRFRNVWIERR